MILPICNVGVGNLLLMLESILTDVMAMGPELVILFGAHEVKMARPKRFIRVREGRETAVVEI
jgi:hypothetical protein